MGVSRVGFIYGCGGVSVVYRVVARGVLSSTLVVSRFSGLAARAAVLKWISSVAGGFVKVLHDERRPKGLSVGPLYVGGRPVVSGVYEAGSLVEVVLGVSESVFEFVKKAFEERAPLVVEGVSVELSEFEFSKLTPRGPPPDVYAIRLITPTRIARHPAMRRKRALYELCPHPKNVAVSVAIHARSVLSAEDQRRLFGGELTDAVVRKLAKWAYTYVAPRYLNLKSRVVYIKGNPQVGAVGCVQYEVMSKSKLRELHWALLQFAEVMGLGNGKTYGLGHVKIVESCSAPGGGAATSAPPGDF